MGLSLNKDNDAKILELAREARKIGAEVELRTEEVSGYGINPDVERTITIRYNTHNSDARLL